MLEFGVIGLVWLSVAAAIVGFVLPWATVDVKYRGITEQFDQVTRGTPLEQLAGKLTKELGRVAITVKRGAETVTGELPDLSEIPTQVSGAQVPQLANRQDVQVVLALTEMLTGQRELGAKSHAVYLLPGLALVCGLLVTIARRVRLVCAPVGIVCLVVAGGGFWKLLTTKTETLLVAITIEQGLWLSLWAYVGIGLAALVLAALTRSRSHVIPTRAGIGE